MLFNSIEYLLFLPIVFGIYWALRKSVRWQNIFLLLASYLFYAWWDYRFLLLLILMSLCSWYSGVLIYKSKTRNPESFGDDSHSLDQQIACMQASRQSSAQSCASSMQDSLQKNTKKYPKNNAAKAWMITNTVIDVGVLAVFKYYNFFVGSFADLFGLQNSIHSLKIVLPLGISFFTFQAIAYVEDVYKRKIEPTNLINCLLYVGFFPKLLSGPIERPTNLIPQIQKARVFEYDLAADGMRKILWGLFKKIVVADTCAIFVNRVWETYDTQTGSTLLLAAILYTIQIYGDFSGYSDMAIGTAKLFGFRFRDNFLFPYFSRNMNEFWRRWHISLNTWFVDYVYIPLGGSRPTIDDRWIDKRWTKTITKLITCRNIMIVFLLSGLWHGADWSFVAWGAYHGLLLVLLILLNRNAKYEHVVAYDKWYPSLKEFGQMVLVFALATIGWILFRAPSMVDAWGYINGMMQFGTIKGLYRFFLPNENLVYPMNVLIIILLVVEWLRRDKHHGLEMNIKQWYIRYPIYVAIIAMIIYFSNSATTFIYFQF